MKSEVDEQHVQYCLEGSRGQFQFFVMIASPAYHLHTRRFMQSVRYYNLLDGKSSINFVNSGSCHPCFVPRSAIMFMIRYFCLRICE